MPGKLSRSGATRLKRLEVVLRTKPGAVKAPSQSRLRRASSPKGRTSWLCENYAHISLRLAQPTCSPLRGDAEQSEAEGDKKPAYAPTSVVWRFLTSSVTS